MLHTHFTGVYLEEVEELEEDDLLCLLLGLGAVRRWDVELVDEPDEDLP